MSESDATPPKRSQAEVRASVFSWVRTVMADPKVGVAAKSAWALAELGRDSAVAFPSNETLAKMVGTSARRVQDHLAALRELGWIKTELRQQFHEANWHWLAIDGEPIVDTTAPPPRVKHGTRRGSKWVGRRDVSPAPSTRSLGEERAAENVRSLGEERAAENVRSLGEERAAENVRSLGEERAAENVRSLGEERADDPGRATGRKRQDDFRASIGGYSILDPLKGSGSPEGSTNVARAHETAAPAPSETPSSAGRASRRDPHATPSPDLDRGLMRRIADGYADRYRKVVGRAWISPGQLDAVCRGAPLSAHRQAAEHLEVLTEWAQAETDPDAASVAALEGFFGADDAWLAERSYPLGSLAKEPGRYAAPQRAGRGASRGMATPCVEPGEIPDDLQVVGVAR